MAVMRVEKNGNYKVIFAVMIRITMVRNTTFIECIRTAPRNRRRSGCGRNSKTAQRPERISSGSPADLGMTLARYTGGRSRNMRENGQWSDDRYVILNPNTQRIPPRPIDNDYSI